MRLRALVVKIKFANHVKIYGSETSRYGSERDAVERFWRNLLGGAASARFHRPPSGLGLSRPVQQSLQAARLLLDSFDLYRARPDADHQLLENRSENEVFLSYRPGHAYLLYFPDGGSVGLDLTSFTGPVRLQWLPIMAAPLSWQAGAEVSGGGFQTITAPAAGHWLVLLRAVKPDR